MVAIIHNFDEIGRDLGRLVKRYADRVERDLNREMFRYANILRNYIIELTPVDTGLLRSAWQGPIRIGFAHYELRNNIIYGPVVEFGGYKGVGPKTAEIGAILLPAGIAVNAGIYPIQRPHAMVRRGLSRVAVQLRDDLAKVLAA